MTSIVATNITSPLGFTTEQNYQAVKSGRSALRTMTGWRSVPGRLTAAALDDGQFDVIGKEGFTRFQSLVLHSVEEALSHADVDVASPRTVLIVSTTKGDIEELSADEASDGAYLAPGESARRIAASLGFTTDPVVVCNACISGLAAQVLADRMLESGMCDTAVVCGADTLSVFTVAGFTSFKALSPDPCKPFDIDRTGLNLGEGAATVILRRSEDAPQAQWTLSRGCLDNDAYHVSAPAPDGEGLYRAMMKAMEGLDASDMGVVATHGTATMFNDQMESKAIEKAGLSEVPVAAFKSYYGHTLGAAGLIESILAMRAADDGIVLPVKGFEMRGVTGKVNVSDRMRETDSSVILKIISGFGGCNGAAIYSRSPLAGCASGWTGGLRVAGSVHITPSSLQIDGKDVAVEAGGKALLTEIYKKELEDNPKFYKMDVFSRLVYLASGIVCKGIEDTVAPEDRSLVLFNASSSIVADRQHLRTFTGPEGFFPSPATFLYTLPNVVTGEIAVRFGIKGETTLLILPRRDDAVIAALSETVFRLSGTSAMITGWVDCDAEDSFEADVKLIIKQ